MAGIAAARSCRRKKFAEDGGMRLPESVFLQTVTATIRRRPALP